MNRKLPVVVLAVSLALASLAFAQQDRGAFTDVRELPAAGVGQCIEEFLEVIGSNDEERVKSFVENRLTPFFRAMAPMEQHLRIVSQLYNQTRGFEFYGIRKYEAEAPPNEFVVIARTKLTGEWQALIMQIEPEEPHRIMRLRFSEARPPSDHPPLADLTEEAIVEELKAFVDRLAAAEAFSGTVLLAKDGKTLFKAAYGLASKRFNVPNRVDTRFNLGSMNKMFTSVAIAQLVQQEKLSFEDPLSDRLPAGWLPEEITSKIQIKHLLTHTSGLGNYFNEEFVKSSRLLFRSVDDYKPLVEDETLAFEPGTEFRYSNTGLLLLGVVIEKVAGRNYFDHVRETIYEPAGMIHTGCYDMDRPVPNLAIGYSKDGKDWTNNYYKHVVKGGPAGGGFSTVEDLLGFDQALRNHKLLNPEYTEIVWSAKPELNSPTYGFGFKILGPPDDRIVGHSGGFSGISANLDMFLDSGFTAVVMSNIDHGSFAVTGKIRKLIAAREKREPVRRITRFSPVVFRDLLTRTVVCHRIQGTSR